MLGRTKWKTSKAGALALALSIALLLGACTRSSVPAPTAITALPLTTLAQQSTSAAETQALTTPAVIPVPTSYAVVWVEEGGKLSLRDPAGIAGTEVQVLSSTQTGLVPTGKNTLLGSSLWYEISLEDGRTGWVNGWNITEEVSGSDFCADPRVPALLGAFVQSIAGSDGQLLELLVSPRHGLNVRHDWNNPEVNFPREQAVSLFLDDTLLQWGVRPGSGFRIDGPFREAILPQLEQVLSKASEIVCNRLRWGPTKGEVLWPEEYHNLNFYAFYRPAAEGRSPYDWGTWAVGVEYVDGVPYLAVLVGYRSEL